MNVIAIRQRTDEVYPPPEQAGELGTISLKWIFAFLVRRRILIAATAIVVAGLCFAAFVFQPSRFTATALVMINPGQEQVLSPEQMVGVNNGPAAPIVDSQIEVFRSEMLIGRLVDALDLVNDPEWNALLPREEAPGSAAATRPIATPAAADPNAAQTRARVIEGVIAAFDVRRRGLTYAVEVSATSQSPERAARMANGLVEIFRQYQLETRLESSARANTWLSDRVRELRADVQEKEAAVERYRAQTGLLSAQGALLTEQQTAELQGSLTQARADLAEREARYLQVQQTITAGGSIDTIAGVLNSSVITTLRAQEAEIANRQADFESRYGELHPAVINVRAERADIRTQISQEVGRIAAGLRSEVEVARARVTALEQNMALMRGELVGNNGQLVQLRELEREAGAARAVYESFLQRFHEIADQGAIRTTPAESISAATPPTQRSSPRLSIAFVLSLGLGLGLGLAAGFLAEALDEGFATAEDVERKTGVPALAVVPKLRRSELRQLPLSSQHPAAFLLERQVSAFTEACRVLRTTILFAAGQPKTQVVAITSALPNEGKTTLSLCLARVSALSGQRVLLIDCDLRRRSVKDVLDFEPPMGLLQVLAGEVDWRQATYLDQESGMHVLPLSDSGFTPKDIFGADDMSRLINELRGSFDLIVLDCAPVLAVADTRVIVAKADCAVVVSRWQKTPVRAVRSALQQLQNAGANVRGVALNSVDGRMQGYYSYPSYDFSEA
jgi:polysaccharide biosynthesis transport protein